MLLMLSVLPVLMVTPRPGSAMFAVASRPGRAPTVPAAATAPLAGAPVGPVIASVLAHAGASMAIRSAAIPREPYALTEPSEMPSVSATCASVMSAK